MIKAKKDLGQNFLIDEVALNKIIEIINPNKKEHFLEIGPGQGAITKFLAKNTRRLDAVELDKDLLLGLRLINTEELFIHNKNILDFDIRKVLENGKLRIVGNLPYNISTDIMLWTFQNLNYFKDIHFMFQKEFGERLSAEPNNKSYGRISVLAQYLTELETVLYLEPESFKPKPKVQSVFIRFVPKKDRKIDSPIGIKLQAVTKEVFQHRRKMVGKSLKKILAPKQLEKMDIDLSLRPENITVEEYIKIAQALI
jgi:dimethyladenosine transferase